MCGIIFVRCADGTITVQQVHDSFESIKNRGPDNSTIIVNDNDIWGHHRLAIINPEDQSGNQPLTYKGVLIVCNGEIYNYKDLASLHFPNETFHVDIEIIPALYLKFGIAETLRLIDGDFAFVMKDGNNLFAARDPIGLKPLFYHFNDNIIAFASEIKALPFPSSSVFPIGQFYHNGSFTTYHQFKTISPSVSNDTDMEITYPGQEDELINGFKEMIRTKLTAAVKKRIDHSDRPYAFLCSGGIDSSIILSIATQLLPKDKIHIFSMAFAGSISYDAMYVDVLASHYQIKHTKVMFTATQGIEAIEQVVRITETYDPNTIRASIPMYLLAKHIKENTDYKVILSGEGADECFLSYNYFVYCKDVAAAADESIRLLNNIHMFDVLRAERCFASHGLELRVPFLDTDFIDSVLTIDASHKLPKDGIEKWLLRSSFNGTEYNIPERVLWRQKERFSDGVGFDWVPSLMRFANSNTKMATETELNGWQYHSPPKTPEESMYRRFFEQLYPGQAKLITARIMPEWAEEVMRKARSTSMLN